MLWVSKMISEIFTMSTFEHATNVNNDTAAGFSGYCAMSFTITCMLQLHHGSLFGNVQNLHELFLSNRLRASFLTCNFIDGLMV